MRYKAFERHFIKYGFVVGPCLLRSADITGGLGGFLPILVMLRVCHACPTSAEKPRPNQNFSSLFGRSKKEPFIITRGRLSELALSIQSK